MTRIQGRQRGVRVVVATLLIGGSGVLSTLGLHVSAVFASGEAGTISTAAGSDAPGPSPATSVGIAAIGVASGKGNLYVTDGLTVRQVDASDTQTAIVGDGAQGSSADGELATSAQLCETFALAADASGDLLMTDDCTNEVQMVPATTGTYYGESMTAGDIYTVAGNGTMGFAGDGGPATSAELYLNGTAKLAIDGSGNLVIGDYQNGRVRVVAASTGTFYGVSMTVGDIYTVAGDGVGSSHLPDSGVSATSVSLSPSGVAVDGFGNLVITDNAFDCVNVVASTTGTFYGVPMTAGDIYNVAGTGTGGFSGDGGPATSAELSGPSAVVVDGSGNLVLSDQNNNRVRVVAAATGTFYGVPMIAGGIYTVAGDGTLGFSGDGGPAESAELSLSIGEVAIDGSGNLVIGDYGNSRLRVVAASTGTFYGVPMTAGDIYTVAGNGTNSYSGDGGPATSAQLGAPAGVAVDSANNLLIADQQNQRVRVTAASTGTFYGVPMTAGDIYTVAGNGILGFSGDGGPATSAELNDPVTITVDSYGNMVIDDQGNERVRVVAAVAGTFYGVPMAAGDIYTIAGNGRLGSSGDGGPATSAELGDPFGTALDRSGNVLIADTYNEVIRVVASSSGVFYGQAMTAGDVYTVAGDRMTGFSGDGGPATSAKLFAPTDVAVDNSGNLVIADSGNRRIRVVADSTGTFYGRAMTAGDIYTIAGNGGDGSSGDGGPAKSAQFSPYTLTVDGSGNVAIGDSDNSRVRVVAESPGSFYGLTMRKGDIYTVAGDGIYGFAGDGGPAISAELSPAYLTVDASGDLVIADSGNYRVREVAPSTSLGISPTSGQPGAAVTVNGAAFLSGETVSVRYNTGLSAPKPASILICSATVLGNGSFTCNGHIPGASNAGALGNHNILADGKTSLLKAKTAFNLT